MDDLGDLSSDVLSAAAGGKPPQYRGNFTGDPAAVMDSISAMKDPAERSHAMAAFTEQAQRTAGFAQGKRFSASANAPAADGFDDFSSQALSTAATQSAKPEPAPAKPANPQTITSPEADLTAHVASSIGSAIAGGYNGLFHVAKTYLQTGDGDKAWAAGSDAAKGTQEALTYQPRTEGGQKLAEGFDSKWNPASWIPSGMAWLGDKAGGAMADNGAPGLGAMVNGAANAAPLLFGTRASPVRQLRSLLKPEDAAPPRIDPTMNPPGADKPRYRLENGQPVLVPQPVPGSPAPVPAGQAAAVGTQSAAGGAVAPAAAAPPVPPRPTVAQASPELQKVVADAQQKGLPINQDVLNRHVDAESLPVPVKLTEGQAMMDPEKISAEMNNRGKQGPPVSPDFYNAQGKALAANMEAVRAKVAPDIAASNPTEMGQVLVDEYKKMDAPVVADIDAKYKALRDANGGEFPVDAGALRDNINAALKKELLSHDAPASQMAEINDLADGGAMTFEHFLSLRRNLGNIARTATDGNTRTAASIMVRQLEELPLQSGAANLKPLADAARSAARNRFQRMDADPAYKAAASDSVGMGEPSALADKFVQGYIINGKAANVKQMKANLADSPTANQAIAAAGVDYLTGMAKADKQTGGFLSSRYDSGLRQLGPKLNDLLGPESAQTVQQIGRVSKYTSAQPKGSYVNNSNTFVAGAADATKSAAEHTVNTAVMSHGIPIPLGSLVRKGVQNRAATKAAQKSVAPGAGVAGDKP